MAETKLSRELQKAVDRRRARSPKFTLRTLAQEAGLEDEKGYQWVRSVVTGNIVTPPAKKLVRLAEPLGISADRLLALSDQLGASLEVGERRAESADVAAAIRDQTKAIRDQTTAIDKLLKAFADRLDRYGEERRADHSGLVADLAAAFGPPTTGGSEPGDHGADAAPPVRTDIREGAAQ